jgi:hypothetical protein
METSYDFLKKHKHLLLRSISNTIDLFKFQTGMKFGEFLIVLDVKYDWARKDKSIEPEACPITINILTKNGLFEVTCNSSVSTWNQHCWAKKELELV